MQHLNIQVEITIGIILYLGMVFIMTGFVLAYWQHADHPYLIEARKKSYRQDLAFSIGISLVPIAGWLVSFFMSGFFEYGWQIRRKK